MQWKRDWHPGGRSQTDSGRHCAAAMGLSGVAVSRCDLNASDVVWERRWPFYDRAMLQTRGAWRVWWQLTDSAMAITCLQRSSFASEAPRSGHCSPPLSLKLGPRSSGIVPSTEESSETVSAVAEGGPKDALDRWDMRTALRGVRGRSSQATHGYGSRGHMTEGGRFYRVLCLTLG